MMTRGFAVIGWGSLIWDLEILTPHVTGEWQMEAGPRLPMEFTRISPKRKMGLAVCLDSEHGAPCSTHVIASNRAAIGDVAGDLAARERAPLHRIGAVCTETGARTGRPEIAAIIAAWCRTEGWTGAVWTDLMSNYREMRGQPFSLDDAMAYVRTLSGDSLDEAVRYIRLAPRATDTPLRRALDADPWWQGEAARLEV